MAHFFGKSGLFPYTNVIISTSASTTDVGNIKGAFSHADYLSKCIEDELGPVRTSYKSNKNTRCYMFQGDKKNLTQTKS